MSIQQPAWLKRTRPCPFYSQGRCLFADSCNFLHDIKVRNSLSQQIPSTSQVKPPSVPLKPAFEPPSVVVDSPSPLVNPASPESLASSAQDLSRYSGLLSVLSDVIGPPSIPPAVQDTVRATSGSPRGLQSTESNLVEPASDDIVHSEMEQRSPDCSGPSSIHLDSEVTLVSLSGYETESYFPEEADEPVAEFLPVPDDTEPADVAAISDFVENTETYAMGSEVSGDDYGKGDFTTVLSNRQSTLSSFTGASLLASPRNSVFEEPNSVGGGVVNLLSPVELSARLQPFPIPSLDSRLKRGFSIDSGYADGDDWIGPLPFPRSPPGNFCSPATFLSHSRRASYSFPTFKDNSGLYDSGVVRMSSHNPIEGIKEVESDGCSEHSLEDIDNATCVILDAYDKSPSEERREEAHGSLQENLLGVTGDKVLVVACSPRRSSPAHLQPVEGYDMDSCNQPSFVSDDNSSFRTALSVQPSYENLSNVSKVSPVQQNSLLPSILGCSTLNSSLPSHHGDANESLRPPIFSSDVYESSSFLVTDPERHSDNSRASEESEIVVSVQGSSSVGNFAHVTAPQKVITPRERMSGASQSDRDPPSLSPSGTPNVVCLDDSQEISSQNIIAPQEQLPSLLHYGRDSTKANSPTEGTSCDGIPGFAPVAISDIENVAPKQCSARLSSAEESPPSPSTVNVPRCASQGTGAVNVDTCSEHRTGDFRFNEHFRKLSSSPDSFHGPNLVQDVPKNFPEDIIDSMQYASATSGLDGHLPSSAASANHLHNPSPSKDFGHTPPGADSGGSVRLAESATMSHADQSLTMENCLGPNETIECPESECENFTQRLSFPLPPPFLPTEFIGRSIVGGENSSVLSETTVMDLGGDGWRACTVSEQEEVQRLRSSSDLTEKMRPSHLPAFGPSNSDADFTWRRSRAASDLTVKGKSPPATIPEDTPYVLRLPPVLPPVQQGQISPVNSLYDYYVDDGIPDDASCSTHKTADIYGAQHRDLTFQRGSSPCSNGECSSSGADSQRSETVLRPLLTGRRSLLRSPLAELVLKAHPDSVKRISSTRPSARLEAREIGSTMVPLGFRRYKAQPAPQTQSSRATSLCTVLPASQLREVLRIRTDLARDALPQGCSSATHVSPAAWSPLPAQSMSAPPTGGLKQLCLSSAINKRFSTLSTQSSSIASSTLSLDHPFNASTPQSPSVSLTTSLSHNSLVSSSCKQIPEQTHHTLQATDDAHFAPRLSSTRHDLRSVSAPVQESKSWRLSRYRAGSRNYSPFDDTRRSSRRASILSLSYAVDEEREIDEDGLTTSQPSQSGVADGWTNSAPFLAPPVHAIATPKPTLLFAIASDDVDQVRQVLESGDAGPNDSVGPQSALAFALTNDKLIHKPEIVKTLLAYGANPSALRNPTLNPPPRTHGADEPSAPPPETTLEGMDPATRYFVARADAAHTRQTSQLIYRSFFRPLTRVRYDVIGQDWALEQLFRVLSMHSQKLAVAPIVVLLCGPSGHGKSLLARKFGFLLDVPTHTVNMTTLRSAHDIWQSYSMSPYEEPSSCTLAEFLIENEGKRCVVVLDEIEKVEDEKALWSLLMPWELGRCSLEAGKRHVDARNVIWLATSNVGHELVFEYHEKRAEPDSRMSREDYVELTAMLRPRVSHCLGASLVSRVTTVVPFVPFTLDEKKAIAAEAIYAFAGEAPNLSPQEVESLVTKALPSYHSSEGARSLHRAVSNILMDRL